MTVRASSHASVVLAAVIMSVCLSDMTLTTWQGNGDGHMARFGKRTFSTWCSRERNVRGKRPGANVLHPMLPTRDRAHTMHYYISDNVMKRFSTAI